MKLEPISHKTWRYSQLCVILEPMQELMSRHKAYALSPRDCLKTTLFQKWQRMVAPPGESHPAIDRARRSHVCFSRCRDAEAAEQATQAQGLANGRRDGHEPTDAGGAE